jgi:hypothetical protein
MPEAIRSHFGSDPPSLQQINELLWSMVGQGLLYIDMSQPAHENWTRQFSSDGRAVRTDAEINPDDPQGYLNRVREMVPAASDTTMMYLDEAVGSYTGRRYLASAVMLGVAAEGAFLEMAESFADWLPTNEGQNFRNVLENERQVYLAKSGEFRKRVEHRKAQLPAELADGMSLRLDSVLDLLRIYRNDAGHPTGKRIGREDAFINLQMAARLLQNLYALRSFFKSSPRTT